MRGAARDTDAVFRYGGDEFVLGLPHSDAAGLLAVAERICSAVARVGGEGSTWRAGGVVVSASIGTASFPVDGATAEDVLLAADRACFVAKRRRPGQGRDRLRGPRARQRVHAVRADAGRPAERVRRLIRRRCCPARRRRAEGAITAARGSCVTIGPRGGCL